MSDEPRSRKPIVRFDGVSKSFGNTEAVRKISFDVYPGDIFGLIGPNGAGKTTTLKLIATLLRPDHGMVAVNGHVTATASRAVRRCVGYMPDFLGVYPGLTVEEYLDFFGATYRIPPPKRTGLIADLLALTDLSDKKTTLVTGLSRGMQQRLGLARALIHDPTLLLLDEPASGLDPRARVEIRELLKELSGMGKTIVISSHILSDLEELCNRIGIVEQGELLHCGTLEDALVELQPNVVIDVEVAGNGERAAELLRGRVEVDSVELASEQLKVTLAAGVRDGTFLATFLVEQGFALHSLTRRAARLEEAFLTITRGRIQ